MSFVPSPQNDNVQPQYPDPARIDPLSRNNHRKMARGCRRSWLLNHSRIYRRHIGIDRLRSCRRSRPQHTGRTVTAYNYLMMKSPMTRNGERRKRLREGVTELEFGLLQAQRDMSQVRPALTQVSYSPLFAHGIEEKPDRNTALRTCTHNQTLSGSLWYHMDNSSCTSACTSRRLVPSGRCRNFR